MSRFRHLVIFTTAFFLLVAGTANLPHQAGVKRVIDGDTVVLESGQHLRYIGIDTPEHTDTLFSEAVELNRRLVEGKKVRLEYDVTKRDGHGRFLAYVFVDGQFVNLELVKAGLARVYTFPPNVKYAGQFLAAQKQAREKRFGIWGIPVYFPEPYYVANTRSLKFHRPTCWQVQKLKKSSQIKFNTRDEALDKGYAPCRNCRP